MKTVSTEGNAHEILEVYSGNSQDKVSGYLEYLRHWFKIKHFGSQEHFLKLCLRVMTCIICFIPLYSNKSLSQKISPSARKHYEKNLFKSSAKLTLSWHSNLRESLELEASEWKRKCLKKRVLLYLCSKFCKCPACSRK